VPGINDKLFKAFKVKLNILPLMEHYFVLYADEMSLKSYLFYDISRDEIISFEDFGNRKTSVSAKSALIIIAHSVAKNWLETARLYLLYRNWFCYIFKKYI